MDERELELKLLTGHSIEMDGGTIFYTPKLNEIIALGESTYNEVVSYLLIDKKNLKDVGHDEASNYEVAVTYYFYDENFRKVFSKGVKLFLREKVQLSDEGYFYFEDNKVFSSESFDYMQRLIRKSNRIAAKNEPEFNPANEQAKHLIDMIMKGRKEKPAPKESINLRSMISGLAWKSNNINLLNIGDLTIYQLYDGLDRLDNIDHYNHVMTGIYTGNVDGKKINFNDIHWKKIIENN